MASRRPFLICTEVVEKATEFTEAALPASDRIRFWIHLGYCADCRRFVEQLRTTAEACRRLDSGPPPETALPPRLREHLQQLHQKRHKEKP